MMLRRVRSSNSSTFLSALIPFTGLEHVHNEGVFQCDLSLGNIMIDAEGNGRLIDFDVARFRGETGGLHMVILYPPPFSVELADDGGFPGYMAVHLDRAAPGSR